MIIISFLALIPMIALGVVLIAFAIWAKKNHGITMPGWLIASLLLPVLLGILFREANSMLILHLTNEVGIPAAEVSVRLLYLRSISSTLMGLSFLIVALVGISETLNLLQRAQNPPSGFWLKFLKTRKTNKLMGIVSLVFAALSSSVFAIYYYVT